ncbi:uncharacterized protein LOC130630605 [Hydractinia symbiolongicarpus]|uniref:uncharacterized protein LOC130630605 n=1 Tax=Hydractinia symbiolongicarpus TaxID=13093 RepID=UPI002549CB85|nr:uncharacterized protein LOC130630605 [Hydractinia symbiolongicarpus]XP_057300147.1 uncharacterized protein LOC130630605 [Hydractinia symbiolongicarpus]XP_057300148.1 uncharacterized protein LOC130630605 [Hydractinia symbiolongicarpus]
MHLFLSSWMLLTLLSNVVSLLDTKPFCRILGLKDDEFFELTVNGLNKSLHNPKDPIYLQARLYVTGELRNYTCRNILYADSLSISCHTWSMTELSYVYLSAITTVSNRVVYEYTQRYEPEAEIFQCFKDHSIKNYRITELRNGTALISFEINYYDFNLFLPYFYITAQKDANSEKVVSLWNGICRRSCSVFVSGLSPCTRYVIKVVTKFDAEGGTDNVSSKKLKTSCLPKLLNSKGVPITLFFFITAGVLSFVILFVILFCFINKSKYCKRIREKDEPNEQIYPRNECEDCGLQAVHEYEEIEGLEGSQSKNDLTVDDGEDMKPATFSGEIGVDASQVLYVPSSLLVEPEQFRLLNT